MVGTLTAADSGQLKGARKGLFWPSQLVDLASTSGGGSHFMLGL